ncbi:MAG TPA: hypothetical protein VGA69_11905 [Nitriliruptorales bacterium]
MSFMCEACEQDRSGTRVVFTTEATDERGVDVELTKRWTLCRPCADGIFDRIGEPSPWEDVDFKTMVMPEDEPVGAQQGGYSPN